MGEVRRGTELPEDETIIRRLSDDRLSKLTEKRGEPKKGKAEKKIKEGKRNPKGSLDMPSTRLTDWFLGM